MNIVIQSDRTVSESYLNPATPEFDLKTKGLNDEAILQEKHGADIEVGSGRSHLFIIMNKKSLFTIICQILEKDIYRSILKIYRVEEQFLVNSFDNLLDQKLRHQK